MKIFFSMIKYTFLQYIFIIQNINYSMVSSAQNNQSKKMNNDMRKAGLTH